MEKFIIKNTNGKEYELISRLGSYSILHDMKKDEYIVAWGLKQYEDEWTWGQGHYFTTLADAEECFWKKV